MVSPPWRFALALAGANLFFGILHPALGVSAGLPGIVRSLIVNAALFVVPGFGWHVAARPATRMLGMRAFRLVGFSILAFFASLLVTRAAGWTVTAPVMWNLLWVIGNAGFGVAALTRREMPRRRSLVPRERLTGVVVFLAAYAFFFWGATRVVPSQDDQDLEVMATGHGLLTRFEPLMLTDRKDVYFFAHPPLLHFLVGGSFLLHGHLDELQYYDALSNRARDSREGRPFTPPEGPVRLDGDTDTYRIAAIAGSDYQLVSDTTGATRDTPIEAVELTSLYARYNGQPHALEARTPNVFFGALTVSLIALWSGRFSRRWWIGVVAAIAYTTSPEVFVRSSYGGYYAIGALACVLILLSWERWRRWPRWAAVGLPLLTATFAALSDHKLVLLPAALALSAVPAWWRKPRAPWAVRAPIPALGFAIGLFIFWGWGLAIAPDSFIRDHFYTHLVDRVTHVNPLGYSGYPTPLALWTEFMAHTAYVLVPVGIVLMVGAALRQRGRGMPAVAVNAWLIYISLTAVTFSVIDWRQTKHLMLLIVALVLGIVPARHAPRWRVSAAVATFTIVIAVQSRMLATLVHAFASFTISPAW